jgi:hypothetical protein
LRWLLDKSLFFRGKLIEESAFRVKDKGTTIYVASGWTAVQRVFWNLGRSKIGPSRLMEVINEAGRPEVPISRFKTH